MDDRRRNVVRKIAENMAPVNTMAAANLLKVCQENVPVNDFHVGSLAEFLPKLTRQFSIELDSRHVARARGQQSCQGAVPRTNFNDKVIRTQVETISHAGTIAGVSQKVLSQLWPSAFIHKKLASLRFDQAKNQSFVAWKV
jgi:hypothetical protein